MSTIADFNNQFKKMHPNVSVATNATEETEYNFAKNNPYKRQITLNNLTKTLKTNYLISFKLDTKAMYLLNDCSWTFADLRVYDTNEITELNFWVEASNTPYTTIFVLVPSIAANANKNIWLYYGNPGLKNKANLTATCGAVFAKSTLVSWLRANEVNRKVGGGLGEAEALFSWENKANRQFNMFQTVAAHQPDLKVTSNSLNGLPIVLATGTDRMFSDCRLQNGQELTIFSVNFATTLANYQSNVRLQAAGDYVVNLYNNSGTIMFIVSNDGGVAGLNSGVVANAWNITACHWKANTTNGFQTFRNNALVAQRNSNNSALGVFTNRVPIRLFSQDIFEFYSGWNADILIFSDALTAGERGEVHNYLNTKYRVHASFDMPTITVGSQTATGSLGYDFLSYAPFSSFNANSEPKDKFWGVASVTAKATITNVFNKVLASGSPFENWNNSTNDSTGKLTNLNSRLITAGTTVNINRVTTQRPDAFNDINDLSKFEYSNLILPLTAYASTDNDWIEFDFFCENSANIDLVNSYIRFENLGNTMNYRANFISNINSLESNRLCVVKIRKSAFVRTGVGTWFNASFIMEIGVRTTSGSQAVNYGNFQLKKNFQLDPHFSVGQPITLGNSVSSNNDISYHNEVVSDGRIVSQLVSSSDISLSIQDYLAVIKDRTFGELDSFPSGFACFLGDESSIGAGFKRTYHSYFLRKVLGFIFPKTYLDVDLDFLLWSDTIGVFDSLLLADQSVKNLNFFVILSTDKIGEMLDRLLNPTFGYLAYDQVLNKIVARNGYTTWRNTLYFNGTSSISSLPTPYLIPQDRIYNYKNQSVSDDLVYNSLKLQLFQDTQENGTIVGFGNASYELQASGITVVFFEKDMITAGVEVLPMTNFRVGGFNVSPAADSNVYNNTGIIIKSLGAIGKKVYLEIENTNNSKRYLKSLNLTADYLTFKNHPTPYIVGDDGVTPNVFEFNIESVQSITKSGKNEYKINNFYTYAGINLEGVSMSPLLYTSFIFLWANPADLTSVDVQYQPDLRYGKVVRVRNNEGRVITGHVLKSETYSEGEEYTNTITVREIK